jgi:hypothetical protein
MMMNEFINALIKGWKSFDRGDLANYPDPDPPADLGDPLTQDEIDFVKSLRKEMAERFDPPAPSCTDEKIASTNLDTTATNFAIGWINPVGYLSTSITYRVAGDTTWLVPNALGNAAGNYYDSFTKWKFTAGFTVGVDYEILLRNECPNSILSPGVILSGTAS